MQFNPYIITNLLTDDRYIGKTTKTIEERWQQHLAKTRAGNKTHLHKAMRKYGLDAFIVDPMIPAGVDITTEAELNDFECLMIHLVRKSHRLYNETDGGEGVPGWVPSDDTRKKMREAGLRNYRTGKLSHLSYVAKIGGRIAGRIAVESGQLAKTRHLGGNRCYELGVGVHALTTKQRSENGKKAGKVGGKISGGQNRESGHMARLGKTQGRKNVESGRLIDVGRKGRCTHWRINLGKTCVCGLHEGGSL